MNITKKDENSVVSQKVNRFLEYGYCTCYFIHNVVVLAIAIETFVILLSFGTVPI